MFRLVKKMQDFEGKIKKLIFKFQFGNIFRQLRNVDVQLKAIQESMLLHPDDSALHAKQEIFLHKRSDLLSFSNEYWKKKSKTNYLLLGDTNFTYYHTHASIRRNKNQIKGLTASNGTLVSSPIDISQELSDAFYSRFSADSFISFDQNFDFSLLECIISEENNCFFYFPGLWRGD